MRSKKTKEILEKLSKKYGIKTPQMQEIVDSPFKFFVQIASEGDKKTTTFDSVRIMKWGLFSVKEGRRQFFKKINDGRS